MGDGPEELRLAVEDALEDVSADLRELGARLTPSAIAAEAKPMGTAVIVLVATLVLVVMWRGLRKGKRASRR